MQNKKLFFLFSLERCILSYVKIVKTEDNAKQKNIFFVFIVEVHPVLCKDSENRRQCKTKNHFFVFSSTSKLDLADIHSESMGRFGQNFRQRRKKSPLTSVCQFYHSYSYCCPRSLVSGSERTISMEMHRKKFFLFY